MTKAELKQRLIEEGISSEHYSLDGPTIGDEYCLNQNNGKWEVFYSERGNKFKLQIFNTETEACDYFYDWLISRLKKLGIID